jgi:hypothetical protein
MCNPLLDSILSAYLRTDFSSTKKKILCHKLGKHNSLHERGNLKLLTVSQRL